LIPEKDILEVQKAFVTRWKFIRSKIGEVGSRRVLEVGAGYGGVLGLIRQTTPAVDYLGLEPDKERFAAVSSYFGEGSFMNVCFEEFEPDVKYDLIFAFELLEHLRDPLGAIERMRGLLEDGGSFVGSTPYPWRSNIRADETHLYVLHPENWRKLFEIAGFEGIKTSPMTYPPLLWRISGSLNPRIPFYLPGRFFVSTAMILATKVGE